ncbi:hypothetical protein ACFYNL_35855 [Streptomyces sp. NPDC007808]|uniref:hypothetical protein n=1 Tax=Streptomyces sp. NPDC007808 TaxID=3364779 RepID=UPI0036B948EF
MLESRLTGDQQETYPRLELPQQAPPIDRTYATPAVGDTNSAGVEPNILPFLPPILAGLGALF